MGFFRILLGTLKDHLPRKIAANVFVDYCIADLCQNGAKCSDEDGDNMYHCECTVGFTGHQCETNIDDCSGVTCQNGGTCRDGLLLLLLHLCFWF